MNVSSKAARIQFPLVRGFTLIEVMVVVAIIAILAAIALPSYTQYIIKSNRSAAESFMLGIGNSEEQFLLDAKSYFCTDTGGCAHVLTASTTPAFTVPAEVADNYTITVTAPTSTTSPVYTVTASPVGSQLAGDTKCKNLTLDQDGAKGINGGTSSTVSDCW